MIIKAINIHKAYRQQKVLRGIDFQVEKKQTIVLSGDSGCGKTTLLRILAGLDALDNGEVFINDELMSEGRFIRHPKDRKIGFVFQQPALWTHMSVKKNIEFGVTKNGRFGRHEIEGLYESLKISSLLKKYPSELSAGQQRRVSLARAIAFDPNFIFLDEGLENLDKGAHEAVVEVIKKYQKEFGFGLLVVSHRPGYEKVFSGKRLIMTDGKLSSLQ